MLGGTILAVALVLGGPWLLALALVAWLGHRPSWPPSPAAVTLGGAALLGEIFLACLRTRHTQLYSLRRLLMEIAVLLTAGVALGPWPGLLFWQGAVGFDAAVRLHRAIGDLARVVLVRFLRLAIGVILLLGPGVH